MPTPAWAEPVSSDPRAPAPSRTVFSPGQRDAVRIAAEPERDPVDVMLGHRGRRRVRTLSFHQAPAREALRAMASIGDFSIVIPDGVADRPITVELRDVSLATAMRAILAAANLEASGLGDGVVAIRAAGSK